jgi:hypothetical protein
VHNIITLAKKYIPLLINFINIFKGRRFLEPHMQMNYYNVNYLLLEIQKINVVDFYSEFTNHGGAMGVTIYFRKTLLVTV